MRSSAIAQRLLALYAALQNRETTFGQVLDLSAACGIDGRRVLTDHFDRPAMIFGSWEA